MINFVCKEIEDYEDGFNDDEAILDKKQFKGKHGLDRKEERRRQVWEYNLKNPPNTATKDLLAILTKVNLTPELSAILASKTYRELKTIIHETIRLSMKKLANFKISIKIPRNIFINALMHDVEFLLDDETSM